MSSLQADIEARLSEMAPDVEVLLAEVLGGHTVRLFIDHPDGVSVALCATPATATRPSRASWSAPPRRRSRSP
jgi:hypothetical protein